MSTMQIILIGAERCIFEQRTCLICQDIGDNALPTVCGYAMPEVFSIGKQINDQSNLIVMVTPQIISMGAD
jgi:hypothetical protein